eukprot:gene10196-1840_t
MAEHVTRRDFVLLCEFCELEALLAAAIVPAQVQGPSLLAYYSVHGCTPRTALLYPGCSECGAGPPVPGVPDPTEHLISFIVRVMSSDHYGQGSSDESAVPDQDCQVVLENVILDSAVVTPALSTHSITLHSTPAPPEQHCLADPLAGPLPSPVPPAHCTVSRDLRGYVRMMCLVYVCPSAERILSQLQDFLHKFENVTVMYKFGAHMTFLSDLRSRIHLLQTVRQYQHSPALATVIKEKALADLDRNLDTLMERFRHYIDDTFAEAPMVLGDLSEDQLQQVAQEALALTQIWYNTDSKVRRLRPLAAICGSRAADAERAILSLLEGFRADYSLHPLPGAPFLSAGPPEDASHLCVHEGTLHLNRAFPTSTACRAAPVWTPNPFQPLPPGVTSPAAASPTRDVQ